MAKRFNLEFQKFECSLEIMENVGNLTTQLFDTQTSSYSDESIETLYNCKDFCDELTYCIQDTRVLYGLAKYTGEIFLSLKEPAEFFFYINDKVIPPRFSYLVLFMTLAQSAFRMLPHLSNNKSEFDSAFFSLTSPSTSRLLKCSIYGGRTLAGSVGQIIRNVVSTDICSEYPTAMTGPMPYGKAYFMPLEVLNKYNLLLQDDFLFSKNFNFSELFQPFIARVYFSKDFDLSFQHSSNLTDEEGLPFHRSDHVLPFVPYRSMSLDYITNADTTEPPGLLEWISHTNGNELCGVYNCVDIYIMRRLGFKVRISTSVIPIIWPKWTFILGEIYSKLYIVKSTAKRNNNPNLELAAKILLNSSIGKFAQKTIPEQSYNGKEYILGKVVKNTSIFQLNSFCMAYSRIINNGHQALITQHKVHSDYIWSVSDNFFKAIPVYCDTDNLIFHLPEKNPSDYIDTLLDIFNKNNLGPQTSLGSFDPSTFSINFTLEFEFWHKCNAPLEKRIHPKVDLCNIVILGKKSYIMQCSACKQVRLKAKGQNQKGIDADLLANKLLQDLTISKNYFLTRALSYNADDITAAIFQYVWPNLSISECKKITSGSRFSFKIRMAKSGAWAIEPSSIERTYKGFITGSQTQCTICYSIIHGIHLLDFLFNKKNNVYIESTNCGEGGERKRKRRDDEEGNQTS
jgi:DNA polymerase type B, organellar and viral